MKSVKFRFILGMIIGLIAGVLLACGIYFLTIGDVAWKEYFEEKLVPNLVIVLSSIGTILLAAMPIAGRVSIVIDKFKKATKDVNDTVENNNKNVNRIACIEKRLDSIETTTANTEKIARIGFCNMNELVTKGYAKEITKVGEINEEKDEPKS
ncbi:MAG TPA: hypothetical protein PKV66_00515 [Candidatus Pelethenecus sp.]|nr:hypothetical protein [Candidatus Pelethenecus sp.]